MNTYRLPVLLCSFQFPVCLRMILSADQLHFVLQAIRTSFELKLALRRKFFIVLILVSVYSISSPLDVIIYRRHSSHLSRNQTAMGKGFVKFHHLICIFKKDFLVTIGDGLTYQQYTFSIYGLVLEIFEHLLIPNF